MGINKIITRLVSKQHQKWHWARVDLFLKLLNPQGKIKLLDLGGGHGDFSYKISQKIDAEVWVADINDGPKLAEKKYGFNSVILEEGGLLPFEDNQFDIVICNSVIEHVTLPKSACRSQAFCQKDWEEGSLKNQAAFAKEIKRVGKSYFVQTPHKNFPIESHTWFPFVNWLSHETTIKLVSFLNKFWPKKCAEVDWNLLNKAMMQELFDDAQLYVEHCLAIPKSIIAYKK
jgi:SAM-dependent methyltransferase